MLLSFNVCSSLVVIKSRLVFSEIDHLSSYFAKLNRINRHKNLNVYPVFSYPFLIHSLFVHSLISNYWNSYLCKFDDNLLETHVNIEQNANAFVKCSD